MKTRFIYAVLIVASLIALLKGDWVIALILDVTATMLAITWILDKIVKRLRSRVVILQRLAKIQEGTL